MIRKNIPVGTEVYHEKWGLFGNIKQHDVGNLVKVDFSDFNATCSRKNLIEIEK